MGKIKFLIFILFLIFSNAVYAGVYTWSELNGGVTGNVKAVVQYNNRIIVAGGITQAGGNQVNNIAIWDDETGWAALGSGFNDTVYALTVYNNELYAAGRFTHSGTNAVSHIAKWNGTFWLNVGLGINDVVRDMVVYNNLLIAAGHFTQAGGFAANRIASWNGLYWQSLGSGTANGVNNDVLAVTVFNNTIIAGGKFTMAGTDSAKYIASYNFSSWQPLGTGMNERVNVLNVYNGQLAAGGNFTLAGGNTCNYIALWNGLNWGSVGNGTDKYVYAMTVYMSNLVIGGDFKYAGNVYCDRIAMWNGTTWKRMMTGMNNRVNDLAVKDTILYAGGDFTTAGGKYAKKIAYWYNNDVVSISGTVRYKNTNQPVMSGNVKALRIDANTRELIYLDSTSINNGSYILTKVPKRDTVYVISFPSDELEDYIPTYYPSEINWTNAVKIYADQNLTNINIFVSPIEITLGDNNASISGHVYLNYNPVFNNGSLPFKSGAILYLKQGNIFRGFAVSASNEQYTFSNIAPGTYEIYAYRAGYTSGFSSVVLGSSNQSVNFNLDTAGLIGIKKINDNLPQEFSLEQNYPNPFNPVTNIRFSVNKGSHIKLSVFDALGREIEVLTDRFMQPGNYELGWNASHNPSGVYFYRLFSGVNSITKKMVLIK